MNRLIVAFGLISIMIGGQNLTAQDQIDTAFVLPRMHHAWGRFETGAWKKVRVTTETLNEQGDVIGQSVADTTTRLISVDDRGYRLQSETTITIGGRQMGKQVSTLWQGFSGEQVDDDEVSSRVLRPVSVRIGSQAVDTQAREFVFRGSNIRRVASIKYSPSIEPHVLEGHTVATDPSGRSVKYRTDIQVVSLGHEMELLEEKHRVSKVKTNHETPKSTVTTLELLSPRVPGGIVASESEELDVKGRVVSRSSLELLDFGLTAPPEAAQPFSGGRFIRKRRGR